MAYRTDKLGRVNKFDKTPQGGIAAPSYLTRTGVFVYMQNIGGKVVPFRELRHPDEVFRADSLATLAAAPVTRGHPAGGVTAKTWKLHAIGHVDDNPHADGAYVAATVRVQDESAVHDVEDGKLLEFSCGYECEVVPAPPGAEYNGERYDGVQRNIRYNHVGMGPANWGRAGNEVRLRADSGDAVAADCYDSENKEDSTMMTAEELATLNAAQLKAATADNLKLQLDAANGRADGLQGKVDSLTAQVATMPALKLKADAADALTGKLDRLVAERATLLDQARSVLGKDFKADGKSTREIQVAALKKLNAKFNDTGKSDEYVAGRFDSTVPESVAADAQVDQLRTTLDTALAVVPSTKSKLDEVQEKAKAHNFLKSGTGV